MTQNDATVAITNLLFLPKKPGEDEVSLVGEDGVSVFDKTFSSTLRKNNEEFRCNINRSLEYIII